MAKLIIRLIVAVADTVNGDPDVAAAAAELDAGDPGGRREGRMVPERANAPCWR